MCEVKKLVLAVVGAVIVFVVLSALLTLCSCNSARWKLTIDSDKILTEKYRVYYEQCMQTGTPFPMPNYTDSAYGVVDDIFCQCVSQEIIFMEEDNKETHKILTTEARAAAIQKLRYGCELFVLHVR